jgi:multiple sugar transport system ATP-binding protein
MTVADNMGFALRMAGVPKSERDAKIRAAAHTLQLEELLDRKPRQLSGGQRQRVAIGRAIVREPKAFLFDEPLSNLDAALRVQMRIELGKLQASLGTTAIYVTHDQIEAMTMADEIVVINAGRIEQVGAPIDLYDRPANLFVAGFIGSPKMNLIGGRIAAEMGAETVGVRPEHIGVSEAGGTWSGTVTVAEHVGSDTFLYVHVEGAGELSVRVVGDIRLGKGAQVHLTPEPGRIHRFDRDGKAISP